MVPGLGCLKSPGLSPQLGKCALFTPKETTGPVISYLQTSAASQAEVRGPWDFLFYSILDQQTHIVAVGDTFNIQKAGGVEYGGGGGRVWL